MPNSFDGEIDNMKEPITHLLIKGENHVWCRPNNPLPDSNWTIYPSKSNCGNCLSRYRRMNSSKGTRFQVRWTSRYNP